MKEKRIVEYRKNGQEVKSEFNFFTKKKILTDIFGMPFYQSGDREFYKINEDVESLVLKNIEFKKNVRIVTPNDTILILDNCTFKRSGIDIVGGNVELYYPNLNPVYYVNRIYLSGANSVDIKIKDDNISFINITGSVKDFKLNAKSRIETIALTGEKACIEDLDNIKNLKLTNDSTTLKNCNFTIDLEDDTQKIETKELFIEDSKLSYKTKHKKQAKKNRITKNYKEPSIHSEIIKTNILNLKNSTIESNNILNISPNKIIMDNSSNIKVQNRLTVLNDTYKSNNGKDLELNFQKMQELTSRKELLSALKGIKKSLTKEKVEAKIKVRTKENK